MTKKLSLVTSALLITTSAAFADSNSIKEAFANGSTSGDITVYTESASTDGETDSGFTAGSIGINYETDTLNGFKLSVGARANHEINEKEEEDAKGGADSPFQNDAILHTLALAYANDDFSISVGRQEIDLEWLGDYNESVVIGITSIPNTTIVAGYTDRQTAVGEDESADFAEVTKDGAYVLDVKNGSIEGVELNPYYYSVPEYADVYGAKVTFENDMLGLVAHYAATNEDSAKSGAAEDGNILHLEASTSIENISLALGYIATDKDGGIGNMKAYGDNIDPTEEIGDYVYEKDAKTVYGSIGTEINGLELSALYADNEYLSGTKKDAKELSLSAGYAFTDELSVSVTFSDWEVDNTDSDKISGNIVYSF